MKRMFKVASFLTVVALMTASAFAVPQLKLTSGAATCTLTDNVVGAVCAGGATSGSGDNFAAIAGTVSGTFTVGSFTINTTTGITKPTQGTAANPFMDLNNVSVSGGAGILVVEFSETGFTGGAV